MDTIAHGRVVNSLEPDVLQHHLGFLPQRLGAMASIRVTSAVNEILWPRLRGLGFRLRNFDGARWKEGVMLERFGSNRRRQSVQMGRAKFGHLFGVNVCCERSDGSYDWIDLGPLGITRAECRYASIEELRDVLERLADAFELRIIPWIDLHFDPPARGAEAVEPQPDNGRR